MLDENCLEFTAIRGVQAGAAFFVVVCPLGQLSRLIPVAVDGGEEPGTRAQRALNKVRVPALARYVTNNPKEYALSPLSVSVDGELEFEPAGQAAPLRSVGRLRIALSARVVVNDGQHRRAALIAAARERPALADETISIVVYPDRGLRRAQQLFADLNAHAVRPSRSLCLAFDHRDERAELTRELVGAVPFLRDFTSREKSGLSSRDPELFTFSSLHSATHELVASFPHLTRGERLRLAILFWTRVAEEMPEWQALARGRARAGDLRRCSVHAHSVAWQALAVAGARLVEADPEGWPARLAALRDIDWERANIAWESRATASGRVHKARSNVVLTANVLLRAFGLPLDPEAERAERVMAERAVHPVPERSGA